MTDFELAAVNAFKYHFPGLKFKCCFFHLGQNFYKKIVNLGLKEQYQNDESLRIWVRMIIALAFLPVDKVVDVFVDLCCEKPDYAEVEAFADYVLENYIDTLIFPIHMWNHFEENDRTNNPVEGYHSKLKKFLRHHPNIWVFIKKIQSEESVATLKYLRIKDGSFISRNRNTKDLQRDLFIQNLKVKYLRGEITLMEYLTDVSKCVHESLTI